jgi:hypothetical protein
MVVVLAVAHQMQYRMQAQVEMEFLVAVVVRNLLQELKPTLVVAVVAV